jgi:hypothetical protein
MKSASKAVSVFKGIKGLVSSGPGKTKSAKISNMIRPEGAVHIDAGNLKAASGGSKTAAGSPSSLTIRSAKLAKGIHVGIRPEPAIKRDSASVIKPK